MQSLHRHGGRLQTRLAALALQRIYDGGAFAADIGARTGDNLDLRPAAKALLFRLLHRLAQQFDGLFILAADIDETFLCTDGIGADQQPLDHRMGVALHDDAVLVGSRLTLVSIADQVFGLLFALKSAAPLFSGGEGCTAAPAEAAGFFDGQDEFTPVHGPGFFQCLITAGSKVVLDGIGLDPAHIPQRNPYFIHQRSPPSSSGIFAGFTLV